MGTAWWAQSSGFQFRGCQNHPAGSLQQTAAPLLRSSDSVGPRWAPGDDDDANHWFRKLQTVLVAGGRTQGVVGHCRQKPKEPGFHCGGCGEPMAGFTEESGGTLFAFGNITSGEYGG